MNIHSIYGFFMNRFRPKRMRKMANFFAITENSSVLDIGGSYKNWTYLEVQPKLTILNLSTRPENLPKYVKYVQGDALNLPFEDKTFDLAYSNSVIEHVGGGMQGKWPKRLNGWEKNITVKLQTSFFQLSRIFFLLFCIGFLQVQEDFLPDGSVYGAG